MKGNDGTAYLANAQEIYRAFGTNCSENPNDTNFSSTDFSCSVTGLDAGVTSGGYVYVSTGAVSSCDVYGYDSYCGIW